MNTQFRISAKLGRKLEEAGVRPADVLRQAGLPPGLFDREEKIVLSTAELFALYRGLAEASRDPAIGLKLGTEHRLAQYDPLAIAAVTARSFRDAIERLDRYKKLTCPEELVVVDQGNESRVEFRYLLAEETEPPVMVDLAFSWVVAIARRGTDGRVAPTRIELQRAENRKMYEAHFRCPVKTNAGRNALVFSTADLDRPFLTHNPDLWAIIGPQLEAELSQALASKAITEQVKGMLKQLMPRGRPGIEDVARELRLSSRTLQRRLREAGATFQQLMQEARRELARHYLLNSSMELNDTAYLLGYEDAHSFFRAFSQWEGSPPGEWRALHARSSRSRSSAAVR